MEQDNQQQFKCTGDCYSCLKDPIKLRNQWHYCASQKAYDTMRMVESMQESLKAMNGTIEEMKAKIEAIQNNEVCVYDHSTENMLSKPVSETSEIPNLPIAQ